MNSENHSINTPRTPSRKFSMENNIINTPRTPSRKFSMENNINSDGIINLIILKSYVSV